MAKNKVELSIKCWNSIMDEWESSCPIVYIDYGFNLYLGKAASKCKSNKQCITSMHKDEAILFYLFVMLAEGLEF